MIKRLLFALLLLSGAAVGQVIVGNYNVQYVVTAPSGSCSQNAPLQLVVGAGTLYSCQGGNWAQVGGSSGPITPTAITCGISDNTACVITGYGSTSGTATLTWPAVAGTATNPIASSNWLSAPGVDLSGTFLTGNYAGGTIVAAGSSAGAEDGAFLANEYYFRWNGVSGGLWDGNSNRLSFDSTAAIGWTSTTHGTDTPDTSISRASANVMQLGNTSGTADSSGTLKLAGVISAGTTFTSSGGLDEGTLVGGATAGTFTTATVTTGSTVITMGNSATAPHGWHCSASDKTHPLDIIIGTSASTTTCTLTVAVAITAGDVIEFSAVGY